MNSYLTTMTLDEFVKHMKEEKEALQASFDEDRAAALDESLKAYRSLDLTKDDAVVPVRVIKMDEPTDALAKRVDSIVETLEKISAKVDDLAAKLETVKKEEVAEPEAKADEPAVEPEAKDEPEAEPAEKSEEPEVEEQKAEDKEDEPEEVEKVSWGSDLAPNLTAKEAHVLGSMRIDSTKSGGLRRA